MDENLVRVRVIFVDEERAGNFYWRVMIKIGNVSFDSQRPYRNENQAVQAASKIAEILHVTVESS